MKKDFQSGELQIRIESTARILRLGWHGRSDSQDPGAVLRPLFAELQSELAGDKEVELDFTKFEYMSSSTIRPIIQFLEDSRKQVRDVRVRYTPAKNWQRLSFKAIEALATGWSNVTVQT